LREFVENVSAHDNRDDYEPLATVRVRDAKNERTKNFLSVSQMFIDTTSFGVSRRWMPPALVAIGSQFSHAMFCQNPLYDFHSDEIDARARMPVLGKQSFAETGRVKQFVLREVIWQFGEPEQREEEWKFAPLAIAIAIPFQYLDRAIDLGRRVIRIGRGHVAQKSDGGVRALAARAHRQNTMPIVVRSPLGKLF